MEGCNDCQEYSVAQGQDGAPGQNAFGVLAANFIQPAVGSTVDITVVNNPVTSNAWMIAGQPIFLKDSNGNFGFYMVLGKTGVNQAQILNLGYASTTGPGITLIAGAQIAPSGFQGPLGIQGPPGPAGVAASGGGGVIFTDTSVYTTTGLGSYNLVSASLLETQRMIDVGDTIIAEYDFKFDNTGNFSNASLFRMVLNGNILVNTDSYVGGSGKAVITITYLGGTSYFVDVVYNYSGASIDSYVRNYTITLNFGTNYQLLFSCLESSVVGTCKQVFSKLTFVKKFA